MSLTLTDRFAATADAFLEPLDVDQYYRLMETGVIVEGAPIELIDGLLVRKDRRDGKGSIATIGTRHTLVLQLIAHELASTIPIAVGHVRQQQPVTLGPRNVPEPDVSVALGQPRDYANQHPTPNQLPLVVEVADSSLAFDLGRKQELYRDAGIAEYWVVNLLEDVIEVFRDPQGERWRDRRRYARGEVLSTRVMDQPVQIEVDSMLS